MILRDDSPVWEQGFTFLVSNPDNECLNIKIYDQKTGNDIGQYTYTLSTLLKQFNMETIQQPFQLQKSGPESKLYMSLSLRILKAGEIDKESDTLEQIAVLSRSTSVKTPDANVPAPLLTKVSAGGGINMIEFHFNPYRMDRPAINGSRQSLQSSRRKLMRQSQHCYRHPHLSRSRLVR